MMFPPMTSTGVSEFAMACGVDIGSALAFVPCAFAPLPEGAVPAVAGLVELPKDEFPKEELPNELPLCVVLPAGLCEGFPNKEPNPPAVPPVPKAPAAVPRGRGFKLPIN